MNALFISLVTENYDKGEWFERALSVSSLEVLRRGLKLDLEKSCFTHRFTLAIHLMFTLQSSEVHETMVNLMCRLRHPYFFFTINLFTFLISPLKIVLLYECLLLCVCLWWIIYVLLFKLLLFGIHFLTPQTSDLETLNCVIHPYLLNNHDIFQW